MPKMLRIDVKADFKPAMQALDGFSERRIRAAAATALTRVAWEVQKDMKRQFLNRLDRPTAFTRNSVRVSKATAEKLESMVFLRTDVPAGTTSPGEYLTTHEVGGNRNLRKFERALVSSGAMRPGYKVVPGKYAKLDNYGNISRSQIVQVLNQLGSNLSAGYRRVVSNSAKKRAAASKRAGREYVALPQPVNGIEAGISERKNGKLLPVFYFVHATRYGRKLRLIEQGTAVVKNRATAEMERALAEHRARLAAK